MPTEQRSQADESHRPHVTLFAGDEISSSMDADLVEAVQGLNLSLQLGAFTLFGPHRGRYVLVHQVVPSSELLQLQRDVAGICRASSSSYFAPGRWSPHVTVARRILGQQLPDVLSELDAISAVGEVARTAHCRRWDSAARRSWLLER